MLRAGANATVRGATMLAGVGSGAFASLEDAAERLPEAQAVAPGSGSSGSREDEHGRWRAFVEAAARL